MAKRYCSLHHSQLVPMKKTKLFLWPPSAKSEGFSETIASNTEVTHASGDSDIEHSASVQPPLTSDYFQVGHT